MVNQFRFNKKSNKKEESVLLDKTAKQYFE